jgi:hypothetical protein
MNHLFNSRRRCVTSLGSQARLGRQHIGDLQKECCTNHGRHDHFHAMLRAPLRASRATTSALKCIVSRCGHVRSSARSARPQAQPHSGRKPPTPSCASLISTRHSFSRRSTASTRQESSIPSNPAYCLESISISVLYTIRASETTVRCRANPHRTSNILRRTLIPNSFLGRIGMLTP